MKNEPVLAGFEEIEEHRAKEKLQEAEDRIRQLESELRKYKPTTEQKTERRYLPGLTDEQLYEMFEDWLIGNSVRFMEKKYDASYRVMRRVCRQKLISVVRNNTDVLGSIIEEAKKDKDFRYSWNQL